MAVVLFRVVDAKTGSRKSYRESPEFLAGLLCAQYALLFPYVDMRQTFVIIGAAGEIDPEKTCFNAHMIAYADDVPLFDDVGWGAPVNPEFDGGRGTSISPEFDGDQGAPISPEFEGQGFPVNPELEGQDDPVDPERDERPCCPWDAFVADHCQGETPFMRFSCFLGSDDPAPGRVYGAFVQFNTGDFLRGVAEACCRLDRKFADVVMWLHDQYEGGDEYDDEYEVEDESPDKNGYEDEGESQRGGENGYQDETTNDPAYPGDWASSRPFAPLISSGLALVSPGTSQ